MKICNMDNLPSENFLLMYSLCLASAAVFVGYQVSIGTIRNRRPRRWWVRPIYQKRLQQGDHNNLFQEMRLYDTEMFFHFTRMSVAQFDELLSIIGPSITKHSNRTPLTASERLAMTIRFLATGSSQQTLAFQFRVGKSTVSNVLKETSRAIWEVLRHKVFEKPCREKWLKISTEFANKWNFPHCIGAIDGKHFKIQCPNNTGSEFFNYKKFFSLVLLATCDANYKFTMVDIGSMGSESDGGVFAKSCFGKLLEANKLDLPPPTRINDIDFPYLLVGDEAFPLKSYMMRPYPGKGLTDVQKIFNYRLSRARRIIENTFGILVSRWRLFQGPMIARIDTIEYYILSAICLHNFLTIDGTRRPHENGRYCPPNYVDADVDGEIRLGEWRQYVFDSEFSKPLTHMGSNNAKRSVFRLRDTIAQYFVSPQGSLPWQEKCLHRRQRANKN